MNNYPTGVIMDSVLEEDLHCPNCGRYRDCEEDCVSRKVSWEDRTDEDETEVVYLGHEND